MIAKCWSSKIEWTLVFHSSKHFFTLWIPLNRYLCIHYEQKLTCNLGKQIQCIKRKKKPPGPSQEALDCLHLEVFSSKVEGVVSRASQDCSICLETFVGGDALIRLPCSHSFQSACLDPWLQTCGDCPYCCRTITIVTSHNKASKSKFFFFLLEMFL